MKRALKVEMTQWGVGHGGFHTADIRYASSKSIVRRYIVDCGSTGRISRLSPRIEQYVSGLQAEAATSIDAVYLSHFDTDHVNGLESLSMMLGTHIQVVRFFVPFLTEEQQLLTVARNIGRNGYSESYVDLVVDPVESLNTLFPGAEVEILYPDDLVVADDESGLVLSGEGTLSSSSPGGLAYPAGSGVTGGWEVIAYAQPDVLLRARDFWKAVQDAKLTSSHELTTGTIRELVLTQRKALRGLAIKMLGRDGSNCSSLIVYSAPAQDVRVRCFVTKGGRYIPWGDLPNAAREWQDVSPDRFGGWLSTGDACLSRTGAVQALLKGLGNRRTDRVMVLAAPHHGSKNNSDTTLWKNFPNAKIVTAHARESGRHHPHALVTNAVEGLGGEIYTVSGPDDDTKLSCWTYV